RPEFDLERRRELRAVERGDGGGGLLERGANIAVERVERGVTRFARDLERAELDAVEPTGEVAERVVAAGAHVRDDRRDGARDLGVGVAAADEEARLVGLAQIPERTAQRDHGINLSMRVTRMPSAPSSLSSAMVR